MGQEQNAGQSSRVCLSIHAQDHRLPDTVPHKNQRAQAANPGPGHMPECSPRAAQSAPLRYHFSTKLLTLNMLYLPWDRRDCALSALWFADIWPEQATASGLLRQ